jgi:hypothetical protein
MNEPPVTVHIERLVLDGLGFTPAQGALVQGALVQEFARLAARAGADGWHADAMPAATAPALRLHGTPQPARVGRDLARSLFATLRSAP